MKRILAGYLLLAATHLVGETARPGAGENFFSRSIVTPHVAWGRPYARGPVRLLAITHGKAVRQIIELAQRLDVELIGTLPDSDDVLEKIKGDWDCAVTAVRGRYEKLPAEARYELLRRVMNGRGLVVIGQGYFPLGSPEPIDDDRDILVQGTPGACFQAWYESVKNRYRRELAALGPGEDRARILLRSWPTWRIGKGRAIRVTGWRESADFGPAQTRYEYYNALLARAVLWASPADKRPRVRFVRFQARPAGVPGRNEVALTIKNISKKSVTGKLEMILRRMDGLARNIAKERIRINPGATISMKKEIRIGRWGGHFVDILLTSKAGRETWGSVYIPETEENPIESIRVDKEYVEMGDTLAGEVVVDAVKEKGMHLRVELIDNFGRKIARAGPRDDGRFSFPIGEDATQVLRVRATLAVRQKAGDGRTYWKEVIVGVPHRGRGQFNYIIWNDIPGPLGYWMRDRLHEVGITAILAGPSPGQARRDEQPDDGAVCYTLEPEAAPGQCKGWKEAEGHVIQQ